MISVNPTIKNRMSTLALGAVAVGLGLHSHFFSDWLRIKDWDGKYYPGAYQICENTEEQLLINRPCPSILLEKVYVWISVICFVGAAVFAGMALSLNYEKMSSIPFKIWDMAFHGIGSLVLIAAGIIYIVSAVQIDNTRKRVNEIVGPTQINVLDMLTLRFVEKMTAGTLTIVLGLFYGILEVQIKRQ